MTELASLILGYVVIPFCVNCSAQVFMDWLRSKRKN